MATEVLRKRITTLEKAVLGTEGDILSSDPSPPIVPYLTEFAQSLGNAVEKRERIRSILRDVSSIDTFLDPNFGEERGIPLSAKGDIILAQKDVILKTNSLLERVDKSKGVLDQSQELEKAVRHFEPKFQKLAKIQVDQVKKEEELSHESLELIQKYNEIIEIVSKSFIDYDNLLSKAEEKK
uniref:Dynactin subunit 3 n=1 Tax=Lepeophtheirus salmonis TaxID=72036 RepID=D3PH51_LEPSM|nr:Dynactin subunit 3 [Lepeophtheirus salmonis]